MLKTSLIEGVTPAQFDKQIVGNLLLEHVAPEVVRKEKLLIGVRNEEGDIYRLIGATKHNSFTNAVEELEDMELVDELATHEGTHEGCDAIFREA
ncbi:hypothetical protein [Massilia endophytica]|uniref:hypothetical protein n=1 Tax=Massilia endophytica TaxID=2899220 RepID=UPI001E46F8DD|nr:hypothetical protein [Massilia endophytica]UGQ46026.1 hypothetical protein LSQ66_19930 [Massilia endophytica]